MHLDDCENLNLANCRDRRITAIPEQADSALRSFIETVRTLTQQRLVNHMPQLIDYIDKIARDKNRDVLYLLFKPQKGDDPFFLIMKPVNAETRSSSGWRKTTSPIIHAWERHWKELVLIHITAFYT